ncbi:MAG: CHAP domain-containing protein [Epsilonproteobacteria bacterium]|nr:CHAP domain-containing protein [Campylobacterota bacterium]
MLKRKNLITLLLLIFITHTTLFAGYSTDVSSTTRGNSYWGSAILKIAVHKMVGSKLEIRITKIDDSKINSAGTFTLREDRHKGNILMTTRTSGYSYYEEFEDIDMSQFSSYPKELYVYYEPDAGGWAWVGPIIVNKTVDKEPTVSSASPSSMNEGLKDRQIYIYGADFTDIEKVYIPGVVNTTDVRVYSSEKIRVDIPEVYGSGNGVPKGDRPVTILFKNGKSVTKSGIFYVEDKEIAIPSIPSTPNAITQGTTKNYIGWGSVSGATLYKLYRATSANGTYQQIYYANGTSYSDSGTHLSPNTTYYYKVKAGNDGGWSNYSNYRSVTTQPVPNYGFSETAIKTSASTSIYVNAQNNPFTRDTTTNNYLIGQCTWYAYGRIMELVASGNLAQQVADDFKNALWTGTGRHAQYWPTKLGIVGEGYSTSTRVLPLEKRKKGLLAIWTFGGYGHVGIVEEVGGDNKEWYILSDFNRADDTNYKRVKYRFDSSATVAGTEDDVIMGTYPTFYELDVLNPNPNNNIVGIDISDANGNIDMDAVKNDSKNIEYVFVKATEGYPEGDDVNHEISKNFLQANFTKNMDNALRVNLKVAPYHFIRPDYNPTIEDAKEEAKYFVKKIKPYYVNNEMLPPVIDVENPLYEKENPNNREQISRWSKAEFTDWLLTLSDKVEELLGVKPILYMNENFVQTEVDSRLVNNLLWVAKYNSNNGEIGESPSVGAWSRYTFWQYTSRGSVSGLSGDVDINIFNGSSDELNQKLYQYEVVDTDNDGIPNDEDLDDDNDGLSDIDELANGLNPLDASDAKADSDGDGYTNAEEILQGTDINDASSKPTPEAITKTITIRKGFGLYGMNSSMTLAQLIEKIGVDNLLSINSSGETYQLSYVDDGLDFLNDFTQLEPFKAVWISVAEDVTIDYEEITYINNQEITLTGGKWYLLNPPKTMSLESIKSQVGENNIDVIQGLVTTYQQQYVDAGTSFLNDFTGFEESKGYWIKLKDDATLIFEF